MLRKDVFRQPVESTEQFSQENKDAEQTIADRIKAMFKLKNVNDKSFNAVNWQIAMDHIVEKSDKESAKKLSGLLTEGMTDTLKKAVTDGSLADSDLPNKDARDRLVDLGLMVKVAEKGKTMNAVSLIGFKFWELSGGETKKETDDEGSK